jgi:hypothetical protein
VVQVPNTQRQPRIINQTRTERLFPNASSRARAFLAGDGGSLPAFLHFLSCALLWAVGLANRLGPPLYGNVRTVVWHGMAGDRRPSPTHQSSHKRFSDSTPARGGRTGKSGFNPLLQNYIPSVVSLK